MKKQKKRTFSKQIHEGDTVTFFFHDNTKQIQIINKAFLFTNSCLLYTSPSPRDRQKSRMPSSA